MEAASFYTALAGVFEEGVEVVTAEGVGEVVGLGCDVGLRGGPADSHVLLGASFLYPSCL